MEGGQQEFLLKLRDSKLKDDVLLEQFYDKIIETYEYGENYLILLVHGMYDVPSKASDNEEMFDASDEVYEYLLCTICPVNLSKAGLSYDAESNRFASVSGTGWWSCPWQAFCFRPFRIGARIYIVCFTIPRTRRN